jgi:hypothetical protein
MFNAPSFMRTAGGLVSCLLAALLSAAAPAQTIDLSLNIFYEDPADIESGGTWQVVGKTGAAGGIAALSLRLEDINSTVAFHAPRGTVNGNDGAGFWILANSPQGEARNVTIAQAGIPPSNFESGDEQSIFYGVGTITNGSPGAVGPDFTSLTGLQGEVMPWAPVPPPDDRDLLEDAMDWDEAALFASGTFAEGVTPALLASTTGQVFTTVGDSITFAPFVTATINWIPRTNFDPGSGGPGLDGDFNDDGIVDAADYITWRKNDGTSNALPNDNGLGTPIGSAHYDLWAAHFGEMATPGGGAGGLGNAAFAVPEPAAGLLGALGVGLFVASRRRQITGRSQGGSERQAPAERVINFCANAMK